MFAAYVYISGVELYRIGTFDYEDDAADALLAYVEDYDEETQEYTLTNSRIIEE